MKKYLSLSLALGMIFLLSACAAANSAAHQVVILPDPIRNAVIVGVTIVLAWLVTQLAARWPWLGSWLGQYVDEAAVVVSGAIVTALQHYLDAVPPQWEPVANAALALVVAILAAYGFIKATRRAALAVRSRGMTQPN